MPRLVEAVRDSAQVVTWVSDPMHGNTESVAGFKTRRYDRIRAEVLPLNYAFQRYTHLLTSVVLKDCSAPPST